MMLRSLTCWFAFILIAAVALPGAAIQLLDDQFDLPEGFHIYRYLDHGDFDTAYSVAFDRQARLYLGDGENIRRVHDKDGDQVADRTEIIAEGFGDRGPQGLLFLEDRIFANGEDRNWILEDLDSEGKPSSRREIGGPVETGGDHHAHGFILGMDGSVYWMAGNDSNFTPQGNITQENSPIREPLGSTVFRISQDGNTWEALGTGCRNPFDVGMNSLGEFLTVDSDHEGQIGLPYYRPVRVTHYTPGSRMGWLSWGDGKLQPYQLDCLPGLHDVGRGSPCGIVFYEHNQFPEKYSDVMFMGDYMNKRGENLLYATTGQILAFHLERDGSTYKVEQETFVKPSDETGAGPKFAVIDMATAPDGSLLVTTRADGVLRVYFDPENKGPKPLREIAGWDPNAPPEEQVLTFPQPGDAWAVGKVQEISRKVDLKTIVADSARPVRERLTAIRLISPDFESLDRDWLVVLTEDKEPEVRAQVIWLLGLRDNPENTEVFSKATKDEDNLVQRRALEALARLDDSEPYKPIVYSLGRHDRFVRFAAMHALSHREPQKWAREVLQDTNHRVRLAGLVALSFTPLSTSPTESIGAEVNEAIADLWKDAHFLYRRTAEFDKQALLEVVRVTQIWRPSLTEETVRRITPAVLDVLQRDRDNRVVMEASKLVGKLRLPEAVPILASRLDEVTDPVLQIQLMDDLASIPEGWTPEVEAAALAWIDRSDEGWHGDRREKGTSYPGWWQRIVQTFVEGHPQTVLGHLNDLHLTGPFGEGVLKMVEAVGAPEGVDLVQLMARREEKVAERKRALLGTSRDMKSNEEIRAFLLSPAVDGGMPELGEELFNYLCMTCHAKGSAGARRGPNLDQVRSATAEFLIDSILEPSRKVDEQFRSRHVTTTEGEIVTGTLLEETDEALVLAGEGDPVSVPKSEVERVTVTDNSAMPENLLNGLTWNEIRDLWAFLRVGVEEKN